jgi:hypothetical protein
VVHAQHRAALAGEGSGARCVVYPRPDKHASAALAHVASGDYAGEHWLASFAVFLCRLKNEGNRQNADHRGHVVPHASLIRFSTFSYRKFSQTVF